MRFSLTMPYRRLPNTDKARLRALQTALNLGEELEGGALAFSNKTFAEIKSFLPYFSKIYQEYHTTIQRENEAAHGYQSKVRMARMYVSHFIQVLNLTVQRNEIKAAQQSLYGLEPGTRAVPDLISEEDLLKWGDAAILGEQKRLSSGGAALYNPSIAKVKVHFEIFKDAHYRQQIHRKSTGRLHDQMSELRVKADKLIQTLWNEIEAHFSAIEDKAEQMARCSEFGVVYYLRKSEKK